MNDRSKTAGAPPDLDPERRERGESAPPSELEGVAPDAEGISYEAEDDEDEGNSPITLDRYLSKRRPPVRAAWPQMFSLLAMLVGLLAIMFFKDSCGRQAAQIVGQVAPATQPSSSPTVTVRYQLPPSIQPQGAASRPTSQPAEKSKALEGGKRAVDTP